jgi:hypothetical protein
MIRDALKYIFAADDRVATSKFIEDHNPYGAHLLMDLMDLALVNEADGMLSITIAGMARMEAAS